MEITHAHLAEILAGIARAHAAAINAAMDKTTIQKKIRPAIQWEAGTRGDPPADATLENLYPRILLWSLHQPHPMSSSIRDFAAPRLEELIPKA